MKFSTLLIGLAAIFFSHLLFAQPSPLLPGTRFVPGDLSKGEFYILANNELKEEKKMKTALVSVLHKNKSIISPFVTTSKKLATAHKTTQKKWKKTKIAFHQHHKKGGFLKNREQKLALNNK